MQEHILGATKASNDMPILKHYMQALNEMAKVDFPSNWPSLMDQITSYLSDADEKGVHTGLVALKSLVKKYRLTNEAGNRKQLFEVFSTSEGFLVQLLEHLVKN